jgi:hypothetical protein
VVGVVLFAISGLVAFLALGRGDRGDETTSPAPAPAQLRVPWLDPEGQSPVVGALDVNPADDALWLSTNTGMFRLPRGARRPERVTGRLTTSQGSGTISEELVIQFRGPDSLYASGHPPEGSDLPPLLGLIESDDGGRTWSPRAELGVADFHAIQLAGRVLVAGRYGEPKINVSRDGGKTFATRAPPLPVTDLEVDPDNPRRWVATTRSGLFTSANEGGSWRERDPTANSYLTWPRGDALYRADPEGRVRLSRDGGATWEDRGSVGAQPQALAADGVQRLYAVLLDGAIRESQDGGATWRDRATG